MLKEKIQLNSWARGSIGQEHLTVYRWRRWCFWEAHFINTRQLKPWHVPKSSWLTSKVSGNVSARLLVITFFSACGSACRWRDCLSDEDSWIQLRRDTSFRLHVLDLPVLRKRAREPSSSTLSISAIGHFHPSWTLSWLLRASRACKKLTGANTLLKSYRPLPNRPPRGVGAPQFCKISPLHLHLPFSAAFIILFSRWIAYIYTYLYIYIWIYFI